MAEQDSQNIRVHSGVTEDHFVAIREARKATLAMPGRSPPSSQANVRACGLPELDEALRSFS